MSKFLVAGILQREAIVKIDSLPLKFQAVTDIPNSVHYGVGGDSYNEAIALKWLGDDVDFFTMIGKADDPSIVNSNANDITLVTDFILPKLNATASAVIFYDKLKQQQIFEDIKDIRETAYDVKLFKKEIATADMCVFANCNFCRPLLEEAKKAG
ncbi:MAG: carbohydrate kinase family protein, partial [Lachnospiraceae bacterium]|nr:carbohydrate kinase family protein [Lachnospiraceae bacterium]